nr:hypothetical protein [Sodalis-like endosymbiont of Proechinophthirus fluctus]
MESEPCQINAKIELQDNGFVLYADFTFSVRMKLLFFNFVYINSIL